MNKAKLKELTTAFAFRSANRVFNGQKIGGLTGLFETLAESACDAGMVKCGECSVPLVCDGGKLFCPQCQKSVPLPKFESEPVESNSNNNNNKRE